MLLPSPRLCSPSAGKQPTSGAVARGSHLGCGGIAPSELSVAPVPHQAFWDVLWSQCSGGRCDDHARSFVCELMLCLMDKAGLETCVATLSPGCLCCQP